MSQDEIEGAVLSSDRVQIALGVMVHLPACHRANHRLVTVSGSSHALAGVCSRMQNAARRWSPFGTHWEFQGDSSCSAHLLSAPGAMASQPASA